jgi:ankyrin repeat protein
MSTRTIMNREIDTQAIQNYNKFLNETFPVKDYKKNRDKITHYLTLNANFTGFTQWLSPKNEKSSNDLQSVLARRVNALVSDFLLSPMHICSMLGKLEYAQLLIDKGCDINAKDLREWTPLHHAAVTNHQELIDLLLKHGASISMNVRGGSYLDLLSLSHPYFPLDDEKKFAFVTSEGQNMEGTETDFKELTGASHFIKDELVMPFEALFDDWRLNPLIEPTALFLNPIEQSAYDEFRKNPPKCHLVQRKNVGWDLCASEDMPPGKIVVEYLGKFENTDPDENLANLLGSLQDLLTKTSNGDDFLQEAALKKMNEYTLHNIDASSFRSLGSLANDSFPNTMILSFYNKKGVFKRHCLVTICEIKSGESIVWDYGLNHAIKMEAHQELREKELYDFFQAVCLKSYSLRQMFEDCLKKCDNSILHKKRLLRIEDWRVLTSLRYLCTTPSAMIFLTFRKIITPKTIQQLISHPNAVKLGFQPDDLFSITLRKFVDEFVLFSDKIERCTSKEQAEEKFKKLYLASKHKNIKELRMFLNTLSE